MPPDPAPRVVVVVPCFKQAHFLPEAVESACAQTYESLEIVIVDDGSPDDTAHVASQLIALHPERAIRLISQPNRGLPASRNRGIESSRAEYILPLDADDKIDADFIGLCVAALDADPGASIAYGGQQNFGEDTTFHPHPPYDFPLLTHANQLGVVSMFRRRAWEDAGGYDERLCLQHGLGYEDWDFWIACGECGHFGIHVPEAVFHYRVRAGSMSDQARDQIYKANVVVNHPVLYSPEQTAWAHGVIAGDPQALAIHGPQWIMPLLGSPPVRRVRSGRALAGARRLKTAALAGELLESEGLLTSYCAELGGEDDATLIVLGTDDELQGLASLLAVHGLDGDDAADLLGAPAEDPAGALISLCDSLDAVLTERVLRLPVAVPRVGASMIATLRAGACAALS